MIKAQLQVDVGQVNALLRKVRHRAVDFEPVFSGPIDRLVTSVFTRQFASEGAFGGSRWAPLKARTLRQKAKLRRLNMGILRRFNRLWASLVKSGGPDSIRVIGPRFYQRGTSVRYSGAHQMGLRRGLPVRQLVPDPLPRHITATIERLVKAHIEGESAA